MPEGSPFGLPTPSRVFLEPKLPEHSPGHAAAGTPVRICSVAPKQRAVNANRRIPFIRDVRNRASHSRQAARRKGE